MRRSTGSARKYVTLQIPVFIPANIYSSMEIRYKIPEKNLKEFQEEMKEKGLSIRDINEEINSEFKNYLYKGHSIDKDTFHSIQKMASQDLEFTKIEHVKGKGEPDRFPELGKNDFTSRLVGILLGDGHLRRTSEKRGESYVTQHYVQITLNEEEERLIQKCQDLAKHLFDQKLSIYSEDSKAIQMRFYSKEAISKLEFLGLETGNKTENQIGVPDWIMDQKSHALECLAGLIDTDGCIYRQNIDERVIVKFSNRSNQLLEDFREMCSDLGISTSKAGKHEVQVAAQECVQIFLNEIKPIKGRKIGQAKGVDPNLTFSRES
jgi:intein/homing endonuclease